MKDEKLIEYLKELKCSKSKREQLDRLNRYICRKFEGKDRLIQIAEEGRVRDYSESDWLLGASVIYVDTKGHMPRRTFHGFTIFLCDTGCNMKRESLVYLKHRHLSDGFPCRIRYGSHRVLIYSESVKGE